MPTLHIEHPVSDMATWAAAFGRFAARRRAAGVCEERVQCPVGDGAYVVIDLGFDTTEEAEGFLHFLRSQVWADPASSPALAGTPQTMILEPARI